MRCNSEKWDYHTQIMHMIKSSIGLII